MALLLGVACSTAQVYESAQAWQRDQCHALQDPDLRARCLQSAEASYEQYRVQREPVAERPATRAPVGDAAARNAAAGRPAAAP